MYSIYIISILFVAICCEIQAKEKYFSGGLYTMPPVKFEAIHPKGFRVSIPDYGFFLFTFRGNLNRELNLAETSQWNGDASGPMNGRWVFEDSVTQLKIGDTIYYWTFVWKRGAGHSQKNGEWTVTEFVNKDGSHVNNQSPPRITPSPQPTHETTETCRESPTAVFGRTKVCHGELIFVEEFDKNSIQELFNWDPEVKFPQEPDYPFNVYLLDALRLEDSVLVVSPSLLESKFHEGFLHERLDLTDTCTGQISTRECSQAASGAQIIPPVITGKLITRNKFNFKFGRVEIRAKLPAGRWLIPEITLEPRDNIYGNRHYESGLVRVAFAKGNPEFGKKLYGGPVLSDTEPYRSYLMKEKIGIDNWYKDFHNYSIVWKPDSMQLYVDGEEYGSVEPGEGFFTALQESVHHASAWTRGTVMAPLDEMFYVALGLRVGGINDFADGPRKPWRNRRMKALLDFWNSKDTWLPTWHDAELKVDFVKIYAL